MTEFFFQSQSPFTGQKLPESYRESTMDAVYKACNASESAFLEYSRAPYAKRAQLLREIARQLNLISEDLFQKCHEETALPLARLQGELGRTTGQLELFASIAEKADFTRPIIDEANPERSPLPKPDLRMMQIPLGPVAVFGASNFPLAFSTAGGDTASALAAGCTVIYKGHPAHPGTTELVRSAINQALSICELNSAIFQCLQGKSPELSVALVKNPLIQAVGFTGSLKVGRHLFNIANQRPNPIPFYGELGSINPIFLLDSSLEDDIELLATQYVGSLTLGTGQFCTNPGVVIGKDGDSWQQFKKLVQEKIRATESGFMLTPQMANHFNDQTKTLYDIQTLKLLAKSENTDNNELKVANQVWELNFSDINGSSFWQEEVFGPSAFLITCHSDEHLLSLSQQLQGQLTACIFGKEKELRTQKQLIFMLSQKVGRLIFNGFPTGVEVSPAMHHGGPYPAATDIRTTSVGSNAIERFIRPISYQNAPQSVLSSVLQDDNPLKIKQTIYTK